MKKFMVILLLTCFIGGLAAPALAAEYVTNKHIDVTKLKGMTSDARNQYITAQLRALEENAKTKTKEAGSEIIKVMDNLDPAKVEAWGTLFGKSIKAIATSLSMEVNKFIRTPVGIFIAALVFYKIAGKDVLSAINNKVFGSIGYLFTLFLIWFSYTRFHGVRKLKREIFKDEGEGKKPTKIIEHYTEPRYSWVLTSQGKSDCKATSAALHPCMAIIATIVASIIII